MSIGYSDIWVGGGVDQGWVGIGYSDIWVGGGVDQGWVGTVLPKVLLRWMPSRPSPLVVAAVSAAAAAADDDGGDDDGGGGGDDDDDDNDNDDNYDDDDDDFTFTCSTRTPVNGKTIHVGDKPFPPRYPSRRH